MASEVGWTMKGDCLRFLYNFVHGCVGSQNLVENWELWNFSEYKSFSSRNNMEWWIILKSTILFYEWFLKWGIRVKRGCKKFAFSIEWN